MAKEGAPESEETALPASGGLGRRRLLRLLLGGSTLAVGGLIGVPVASYLRPLEEAEGAAVAAFPDDELGLWEAKQLVVSGRPVLVVNTGQGYKALSAVCTHLGCRVRAHRDEFRCPCHQGVFTAEGEPKDGPVTEPLARYTARVKAERIQVML